MSNAIDRKDEGMKELASKGCSLPNEGDEYLACDSNNGEYKQHPAFEKVKFFAIAKGEQGMRAVVRSEKGHIEPEHFHSARSELFVLDGKFKVTHPQTGKQTILTKGWYYCLPPKCHHTVECLETGSFFVAIDGKPDYQPIKPKQ